MKAYLAITGTLFGLIAAVHVYGSIVQRARFTHDTWFLLEGPGLGLISAAFSVWAWRLFRQPGPP